MPTLIPRAIRVLQEKVVLIIIFLNAGTVFEERINWFIHGGNGTSAMTEQKSRQGIKVYHCKRPARWQSCRSLGHLLKFLQKYIILVLVLYEQFQQFSKVVL